MPSKYGKYQVKKKKPVEPALVQLQPPDIVVGHNEEWLEAAPTILRFWEKLSLEPYSNRKNISYFVVYPEGADMENSVCKFWRELSVVFETSLLGKHQAGILQDYKPGLVPISLLPALPGETMEARQVRSYLDGCQQLGLILGGNSALRDMHTVVYMINPFSHGAGYFDLCRCFSIMKTQFRTAAMGSLMTPLEQQRERLVLQLVPIQHVIYPSTFGGYLRFGLKDIAFTVYSKCKVFLERPVYSQGTMAQFNLYAPSFALAKTLPAAIHYESGQKPNMVPKPQATIHVGYGFSLDKRWLICVWTDHRGEMLEHMTMDMTDNSHQVTLSTRQPSSNININGATTTTTRRSLEACLQEIWARTLVYQKRALFNWKTVICKLGLMPRPELQAWIRLTGNATHTSIVAVNMDSPLRMYPHNRGTELLSSSSGMISNASGIITPKTPNIGTSSSMVATSLSQGLGTNASAVSGAGAPDGSTAATTHMSSAGGHGAGTTGLGIAGAPGVVAAGGNPGSQAGGGGAAGVGGLAPGEELENSVGQVYAMLLNHRVPLIVSRQESSWFGGGGSGGNEKRELGLLEQQQAATNDESESKAMVKGSAGQESVGGQEQETKGDVIMGDSFLVSLTSSSSSLSRTMDQNQDVDMDAKMKQEEVDSQQPLSAKSEQQQEQQQQRAERKQASFSAVGNDVILPLSTGYLIQVPIQSNSVMREKHSLEAMGVEVHLLHLQRTPMSSVGSIFPGATASGSSSTGGHGSPLPHHQQQQQQQQQQQHSTAYHLQRHNSVNISGSNSGSGSSNGNPSVPGQSFRTSTYPPPPQYPGTSPLLSSSSTFMGSGNNNNSNNNNGGGNGGSGGGGLSHPQGPNQTQQQAAGGAGGAGGGGVGNTTTVKATVAASTTREILKQFHALS
ncbi:mediator of RNA polymerase II transcription subunit 13, partial [Modicella reniformis]